MFQPVDVDSSGSERVIAPETSISAITDGLRYRGYAIEDLVEQSSFLEVTYLVVRGELPSHEQMADLQATMTEASTVEPDLMARIERIPLKKLGTADDVAHMVAYFCGDAAKFITGAEVVMDGGMSLA